jgi:uncharacterized protein (TIGR03000 family)
MCKRWVPAVAAVALLLGNAGTSSAQFIFMPVGFGNPVFGYGMGANPFGTFTGYYPGGFGMHYFPRSYGAFNNYGPVSTGIMNYPTNTAPTTSYVAFAARGSSYGSPVAYVSYTLPDQPGRVDVTVPAGAELWFDCHRTSQGGTERTFTTPLEKGRGYHYEVRARWVENGKTVEQTQSVPVSAGTRGRVVFPKPRG